MRQMENGSSFGSSRMRCSLPLQMNLVSRMRSSTITLPLSGIGITLPQAVRLASLNPARAVGLADRGEIAPERRADMVRVRVVEGAPIVRAVWREGERIV